LTVDGVIFLFPFAGRAGEVMRIVVMHVARLENLKIKERHKEGTARPKRGKRITGKQKTAVDMV